ncbi:hypothetical protein H9Q72_014432 [Fusarium xylarioides]|uniref:Cytochrome P450 monooxygenase n=1 Tax=Fusarium xylarioides TaxID=221167 RepID=A0A9P7L150_9HYPO|nr:hypothetical protein H9Q72_014432 [Fusarium xylarioides]
METFPAIDADNRSVLNSDFVSIPHAPSYLLSYALVLLAVVIVYSSRGKSSQLAEINPRDTFEFSNIPRLRRFISNSVEVLTAGATQYLSKPYRLFCEWGELTILPPESVNDIRSDRRFDFTTAASDDTHGYIPGFNGTMSDPFIVKVVSRHLTKALTKVTAPLSEEAAIVIQKIATDSPEWRVFNVQENIMSIVSRMSSRVFMGEELCRDDEWNKASEYYALKAFQAGHVLDEIPRWLRPYIHWFLPCCQEVRRALSFARKQLAPHIERREKIKAAALARGEKSPFDDGIEWFAQAGSTRQPADVQIALSLVANHTTTDLFSEAMINIAAHPELFQLLREEVIRVLGEQGLTKTALYELKLMDSVLKETQRLKPILLAWKRIALEDTTLPNGMTFKKGKKLAVGVTHMWSDEYYKGAKTFDPYRFLRMRETPGEEHMAHLVSTSQNHLGFGHGVHACPGRFFASNEIKIALCHLLLKYDWKLTESAQPPPVPNGMFYNSNPTAKLLIRRRKGELDFSTLDY